MQCNERCSIRGRERERKRESEGKREKERRKKGVLSAPTFETQINAIIHEISWRNQTHLEKRSENILQNYTPERALAKKTLVKNASVIPKIYYGQKRRGSIAGISRFGGWKGADFRHLAERSERDSELEKRVWEKTWEISTRTAKSNGWRTVK